MPRRRKWTKKVVIAHFEDGRGHGTHGSYQPWQNVREFTNSWGNETRVPSVLFDRPVQTMSYLERSMLFYLEFNWTPAFGARGKKRRDLKRLLGPKPPPIRDYRDQFPIDPNFTVEEAKKRGIVHSRFPETGLPLVMNVDAFVPRGWTDEDQTLEFWDAKPTSRQKNKRVLDKLSLHSAFADHVEGTHHIFDEKAIPRFVRRNIELVRSALPHPLAEVSPPELFTTHLERIKGMFPTTSRCSVSRFCSNYDEKYGLEYGSAIQVLWCLVWSQQLELDLDVEELEQTMACRVVRSDD